MDKIADIFIIGGGINGAGIAADAAGRGLSVILCEQNDLASATSSASTKLIHGGLRYLEYYDFALVKKALKEREILLNAAPHIIEPLRFLLPLHKGLRPAWLIRLGLFIYDHMGGRKILPATTSTNLNEGKYKDILKNQYIKAYEYSDCRVDDARLVVLNAMTARDHGAQILTRHKCTSAVREDNHWLITLENANNHKSYTIKAKALVNAAGPWVDHIINDVLKRNDKPLMRLVKGSHIIVPKLYDHDHAYLLQGADQRIIFTIPYHGKYTLIGTTDIDYKGSLSDVMISEDEIHYLCQMASDYFKKPIMPEHVVNHYSGVRPIYNDGANAAQEAKRDFVLKLDGEENQPPLLNIIGGKITTYRVLSEKACKLLKPYFPKMTENWTATNPLPGGDFDFDQFADIQQKLAEDYPYLKIELIERYMRTYGTKAREVLKHVKSLSDMGPDFGAGLYLVEAQYLKQHEWAITADDILWRRTKLGFDINKDQRGALIHWLSSMI